jgi:hypothetical protein
LLCQHTGLRIQNEKSKQEAARRSRQSSLKRRINALLLLAPAMTASSVTPSSPNGRGQGEEKKRHGQ